MAPQGLPMYGQVGYSQFQISFGGMTWGGSMATGVSTIQAIDSSFNGDEFVTFAQGAFLRVMEARANGRLDDVRHILSQPMLHTMQSQKAKDVPKIATIQHATIYDARRDNAWDSVTIRIAAKTTTKKKNDFIEDWTFQRPAVTGSAQLPHECPSCGAPLSLDENGACKYCRVSVSGARGGWKLVRALPPPEAPKPIGRGLARAWWAFWIIFMILMTVVLPIGIFMVVPHDVSDFGFNGAGIDGPSAKSGGVSPTTASGGKSKPGVPIPSGYAVSGSFTGGVVADADGKVVMSGGMSGACSARSASISGLNYVDTAAASATSSTLTVTVNLPAGSKGAGEYAAATGLSISASFAGTPDGAAAPAAQSWTVGPTSTATLTLDANANATLTFADLQPSSTTAGGTLGQPLSGSLQVTCS